MFKKYLSYIIEHKINVFVQGRKLDLGIWQLLIHDLSKLSRYEFKQYKKKFFGKDCGQCIYNDINKYGDGSCSKNLKVDNFDAAECVSFILNKKHTVELNFNLAWLHHQHNNKHHWQYWIQIKKNSVVAYEMPEKYALEMIADWNAMSYKFQDKNNILKSTATWYQEHSDIILHKNTRKYIELKLGI